MVFKENIKALYGEEGEKWLDDLPTYVNHIVSQLNCHHLQVMPHLTYHYVLEAIQNHQPVILKIGFDHKTLDKEAFALNCFKGHGAINVLAQGKGWILLEKALPGTPLNDAMGLEATSISVNSMKKLHAALIPDSHPFLHVREHLALLDQSWDMPLNHLQKARSLRNTLLKSPGSEVLLHGDLHHGNILHHKEWVVIDPKGVVGYPINEVWAFVMDMDRDIPFISHACGFKLQDVYDWYFVHLTLAASWNLQDNTDASLFLNLMNKAYNYVS